MAADDPLQHALGRLRDHQLRADLADDPGDGQAQVEVGHDAAVGHAQPHQVGDADVLRRGGLLLLPQRGHVGAADRAVAATGIAAGDQAVGDLHAGVGQRRHGAGGAEVDVVGVGHDHQGSFDLVRSPHRLDGTGSGRRLGADGGWVRSLHHDAHLRHQGPLVEHRHDTGEFFCPKCGGDRQWVRCVLRRWFTVFFVPLFPMGRPVASAVQCTTCATRFDEDVLGQPTANVLTAELQGTMRIAATEVVRAAGARPTHGAAARRWPSAWLGLDVYDRRLAGRSDVAQPRTWRRRWNRTLALPSAGRCIPAGSRMAAVHTWWSSRRSGGPGAEGAGSGPSVERTGHGLAMSPGVRRRRACCRRGRAGTGALAVVTAGGAAERHRPPRLTGVRRPRRSRWRTVPGRRRLHHARTTRRPQRLQPRGGGDLRSDP